MTKIYLADTHLIDRSKENKPSTHKVYFLQRDDNMWKDKEIAAMKSDLQKSRFLKRSKYGIFVCHSDLGGGYSLLFDLKPNNYILKLPTLIRNINLETPKPYSRAFPIVSEADIVPSLNIVGSTIANFENKLLIEKDTEYFKEEWYPEIVFKLK